MFRLLWLYICTLPARWRAYRLGLAFMSCPSCRRPFSIAEVWTMPGGPVAWMDSPTSGRAVCKDCQRATVKRNRATYGRDMVADPYPPGMRIEP